jgi:hypothetical protein
MLRLLVIAFLSISAATIALADAEFSLTIDGEMHDATLGTEQTITLKNGQKLTFKLERKATVTFKAMGFAFAHPGYLTVASKEIENGVFQYFLTSATGTIVLVQTYNDLDATALVDLMMGQITNDDVAAGAIRDIQLSTRTLADQTVVSGKTATVKAPGDDVFVEVLAKKQGRGGVILLTRIDRATAPEDQTLIDQFWSTLQLD